ncbi:ABC transporter ATP-binding protein [Labrenzia sp. R5_0]|jgi:iron(III) transport system ATP-binding protein|uniref:ABC transporter ATP-binding protein n=1 Tax=Labrenzia sp. R5_0 TaxID=2821108 RepID=UPI001ADD22A2|nr:ABC transporter ATP-binding protein [Labrenzia sp. R5_0]MBO9463491.1 ABC transporter ATP-binding protein [Labrenzia sp. R5_0]
MSIQLASVSKSFDAHKALNSVSLSIEDGTFFVVLGPSGCGKSTLLRAIAGLEPVDAGEIKLSGQAVAGKGLHLPPEQRQVGVVFQSYALWPHMNVAANVAFPLETAGETRSAVAARVAECLETVALTPFRQRKPAELSGGQRQRVALARCLAQGARTVLMDEPLANLDPHLRSTMEEELAAFHRASGATTLFITHDQREAMALADKVAVMWDGSILQADDPDTLYRRPNSKKVAGFIGRSTLVPVDVLRVENGEAQVRFGNVIAVVECPDQTVSGPATLLLRPQHLVLATGISGFEATVERTIYRGGYWEVFVRLEGLSQPLLMVLHRKAEPGELLQLDILRGWVLPE